MKNVFKLCLHLGGDELMSVLVTGGAGFIGSHTCVELLEAGYDVIVIDNLSNSSEEALKRVSRISGKKIKFYCIDLLEEEKVEEIFKNNSIDSVIHFAGFKAVGISVVEPLSYYNNNVTGTIVLLNIMKKYNVKKIVFSSSATVYKPLDYMAIDEKCELGASNPYGRTKLMIEQILNDIYYSDNMWSVCILRYFNPIGAHSSGEIGEDPNGIPNNLLPYISQVAYGALEELKVYGDDYQTEDGTGVRDYIHVMDIAVGHVKAIEKKMSFSGLSIYNLGTGRGYSVMEIISVFEKESRRKIRYKIMNRRTGDIASCYANPAKAQVELGWNSTRDIEEMCRDAWNWQLNNPNGYKKDN